MRKGFATAALISGILGLLAGLNEWFLQNYVLELVGWDGPLMTLSTLSWFLETSLIGVAVILVAISVMMDSGHSHTEMITSAPPPPLPTSRSLPPTLSPESPEREWPKRKIELEP